MSDIYIFLLYVGIQYALCFGLSIDRPAILVISFDGFRHDYTDKVETPNLDKLKVKGAHGNMVNVFETKTFPNHQSIATGLYPESHGILANNVYDPEYKRVLNYSKEFWDYNDDITPIWTLNELAQNGRHSGVMMWPGSEFGYRNGAHPTFGQAWNQSWSWEKRVDIVINWLLHPETPINFAMLYIEEPDYHAHAFGPDSSQVTTQIKKLDSLVGYLTEQLKHANISDCINIFLLSDHGMTSTEETSIIDLSKLTNEDLYLKVGNSPVVHIYPFEGFEKQVYHDLKNASLKLPFNVYTKEDTPKRWHVTNSRRAPPILVVADEGYAFQDLRESINAYAHKWNFTPTPDRKYGIHGYDNQVVTMHPFFLAWGPCIRKGVEIPPFNSVDLYPLWAHLLLLHPSDVHGNGSLTNSPVQLMLVQPLNDASSDVSPILITVASAMVAAMIIGGTGLLAINCLKRRHGEEPTGQPYRRMRSYEFDAEEGENEDEEEADEDEDMGVLGGNLHFEEQRLLAISASQ